MKKIVVISQNRGFFGAQIVHIPLLRALKELHPESKIYFFSKNSISSILLSLGVIDELIKEESKKAFFVNYIKINPDITINLRGKSLFHILSIIIFNRKTKIGFSGFLSNLFFDVSKKSNTSIYRAKNYLSLIDKEIPYKVLEKQKKVIMIPGAGGDYKMWSINNYINLAELIKSSFFGFEITFVLGEKEKKLNSLLKNYTVYLNRSVNDLFDLIEDSSLVIANDCGPSHIAHISDVNIITILSNELNDAKGITNEWVNTGEKCCVIKAVESKSINSITVDTVFKEAKKILLLQK
jgi:ADP-heptose:LPS heptosyltransferase